MEGIVLGSFLQWECVKGRKTSAKGEDVSGTIFPGAKASIASFLLVFAGASSYGWG
jgi:hypothetical protein